MTFSSLNMHGQWGMLHFCLALMTEKLAVHRLLLTMVAGPWVTFFCKATKRIMQRENIFMLTPLTDLDPQAFNLQYHIYSLKSTDFTLTVPNQPT